MAIKPKTPSSPEARKQIEKDVAAFLKSGKKIQRIPSGVSGQDGLGNRKQLVLGPSSKSATTPPKAATVAPKK